MTAEGKDTEKHERASVQSVETKEVDEDDQEYPPLWEAIVLIVALLFSLFCVCLVSQYTVDVMYHLNMQTHG